MKKNTVLIVGILFMFVVGLQTAAPASAAKLKMIDHGSIKFKDPTVNGIDTFSWKTYQRGTNYVEMVGYLAMPGNVVAHTYVYLQKVSPNKLKMYGNEIVTDHNSGKSFKYNLGTQYYKTKLTAAQCYWKFARSGFLAGISGK